MRIAILGNGKMGKRIAELAIENGDKVVAISDSNRPAISLNLKNSDVAIDFSTPDTAFENISHSIINGIPTISGTTGWLNRIDNINELCIEKKGAFLYSSNFSLGMNIFYELNKKLAELMRNHDYKNHIYEVHHNEKKDTPSGTAIKIADDIKDILNSKPDIISKRIDDVTGTHQIIYSSKVDNIEIKHTAKNRDGFAIGALLAAKWLIGKRGIFSINDIIT
tara:strand:- start:2271 stop:2936 length:666 start_codon:yes stop_codon:yes gene_type:complete